MIENKNNTTSIVLQGNTLKCDEILHCESLFFNYWTNLQFVLRSADSISNRYKKHVAQHTCEMVDLESTINSTVYNLNKLAECLTAQFAREYQWYVQQTYNIEFDRLLPQMNSPVKPITSCSPLIEHIINQVGRDFTAAGKRQIKDRFQNCFKQSNQQPVLDEDTIWFPSLASVHDMWLDEPEPVVARFLLDAIALFHLGQIHQPPHFPEIVNEWRQRIEFNIQYMLLERLHLKASIDEVGNVTVFFNSHESAQQFYDTFELDRITIRHLEKKPE